MADAAPVAVEVTAVAVELPSLETRIEWFEDWEESTSESQKLARRDRAYMDGDQWSSDELAKLKERHQPPLVKNRIARKINFIRGEEIRKRIDPVARPRTPQHEDAARAATDALRYVEEEQRFDQVRSSVLANMLVEGYGGGLKELEECDDGNGGIEYKHRLQHVQWDRLFYDPHSRNGDFSDAKYLGVILWMDLDDAAIRFPEAAEAIRGAVTRDIGESSSTTEDTPRKWVDRKRERVKLVEMYFRIDKNWFRCVFTKGADLEEPTPTGYLDERGQYNVCPLVMASCYVDQDGMRYGVVRQLISPQDEVNKRASKALHLLSVRQVIAEKDSIPDPEKFQAELAKPDGYAEVAHGALSTRTVEISPTGDLAQGHVAMMQQAIADLDSIGPSSSTLPDIPESSSGRAFIARQQAASQELGPLFDSLRNWSHRIFELDWLCIRQWWTEEKWLRVTDDQEMTGYRFVALNHQTTRAARMQELLKKGSPPPKALETAAGSYTPTIMRDVQQQAQAMAQMAIQMGQQPPQDPTPIILQHPLMQEPIVENQVEHMLVDIVIDEAPETAILAQEQFQTLTEMVPAIMQSRPDLAPMMAKLIVRASQLPDKRELLAEFDKPPDQQQQQMQQVAQQMQMEGAKAGIAVQQSQAQLNAARAASEQAKVQQSGAKVPSEIEKNQASAMRDAAHAGEKMGGGMMPPMGAM
jgi:hypothetical protein